MSAADDTDVKEEAAVPVFDQLVEYVGSVTPAMLGASDAVFKECMGVPATQEVIRHFVDDVTTHVMVVRKLSRKADGSKGEWYSFETTMKPAKDSVKLVAFVKATPTLDPSLPIVTQVYQVELSDVEPMAPFSTIFYYVKHCFLPFSRAMMTVSDEKTDDINVVRSVNSRLGELEVELLRSSKHVEIPRVQLEVLPEISRRVAANEPVTESEQMELLQEVQRALHSWKKQILAVTGREWDVLSGTTMEERNFWATMLTRVDDIAAQLKQPEIEYCFELLRKNRRYLAVTAFEADIALTTVREKVNKYMSLLRDLPINVLLAASDVPSIIEAVEGILNHLRQIKRFEYPIPRVLDLLQTIARDVATQLRTVLNNANIMSLDFPAFDKATTLSIVRRHNSTQTLLRTWTDGMADLDGELRDRMRKYKENFATVQERLNQIKKQAPEELSHLINRVREVRTRRDDHQKLKESIEQTLDDDPVVQATAMKSVEDAYEYLRNADVLDTSTDGTRKWNQAFGEYAHRIEDVEKQLEQKIKDLLSRASDASEMFRVCGRFNALFERPRIEAAIRAYQDQLMDTVRKDIELLQHRFRTGFERSDAARMSEVLDIPPTAATIIWRTQIDRQLLTYARRVEDVLGKGWSEHAEGKSLKTEIEQFKKKLSPAPLFDAWLRSVNDVKFDLEQRLVTIADKGQGVTMNVNFDSRMVTLFKEVRFLKRYGFNVPAEISIDSTDALHIFPLALRLEEMLRIFTRVSSRMEKNRTLAPLVASKKGAVHLVLRELARLHWDDLISSSRRDAGPIELRPAQIDALCDAVTSFQEHVDDLLLRTEAIDRSLTKLRSCKPSKGSLRQVMNEIQEAVEHLDKQGFSNLSPWVAKLNHNVEEILVGRLGQIIKFWVEAMDLPPRGNDKNDDAERTQGFASASDFVPDEPSVHTILIKNQVLQVEPPLENARLMLARDFQSWIGAVLDLPRLNQFWSGESKEDDDSSTFRSALSRLSSGEIANCFDKIEEKISAAREYVNQWLQYQALWDMDMEQVLGELGDDLRKWERLMLDMRHSRNTIESSRARETFGSIVVQYQSVQSKVNEKYDLWHKQILSKYGLKVGDLLQDLLTDIEGAKKRLETTELGFGTTKDIVEAVTLLQSLNERKEEWKERLTTHVAAEKNLQRQRYNFPEEWLSVERVLFVFQQFEQILQRKLAIMNRENDTIRRNLVEADRKLGERINKFCDDWKRDRPTGGDEDHNAVNTKLGSFHRDMIALDEELDQLNRAKKALKMEITEETKLAPIREELQGLKEVWDSLIQQWAELDKLRETRFVDLKPIELRRRLTAIQESVGSLPNHMRQYEAYNHLRNAIKGYLEMNGPMVELNSGVLRAKHHALILKTLGIDFKWQDLTVGLLWQCNLRAHMKAIRRIIEQAQGESALEEFLLEIAGVWQNFKLELVSYRDKCFLVRNWDPLFQQLNDHISDLQSMRQSPYFAAFERDATEWEENLNHAQEIFDVFVDVQRRWVYLEGIFNNSADVQHQLAAQYSRFMGFDREFVRLMREIKGDPSVLIWIRRDRALHERLTGYADLLHAIQKALGEYLEKQRSAFPRFYFVGDEDLLEIIGNAKDPVKVIRHLPKMFAGISSLTLSENGQHIHGMVSKEGEKVQFREPISVAENPSIQAWLGKVEYQMQFTLASLLEEAVTEIRQLTGSSFAADKFFGWVDKYPAQIIIMASQVSWSEGTESVLQNADQAGIQASVDHLVTVLTQLADRILDPGLETDRRKKYEQLITELVHQRDTTRQLLSDGVLSELDNRWESQIRFYFRPQEKDLMRRLQIRISRASFFYGFEYMGVGERLVQTPLTDRAYLTLAEAMHMRLGGNPFGPAGTGKTETVKAMGSLLGRFVLVFNCDEHFDLHAMGRIFIGLCQCGAWGCFDEFNRLEERILSAVSQQIQSIQIGLRQKENKVKLIGREVNLHENMGIFVTMNPGYAGRSNLPDNLKQLFRGIAMIQPDRSLIAQVMLYSQGFRSAEHLAGKIVLLFQLCSDQLSNQSHYDFGLRALKSVLRSAGALKRTVVAEETAQGDDVKQDDAYWTQREQEILVRAMCETVVPKLIAPDSPLFTNLVKAVFPTAEMVLPNMADVRAKIVELGEQVGYVAADSWVNKTLQLCQIQNIHHGVIMVGPSGTGKSSAWNVLLDALEKVDGMKSERYVIDPKSMRKDELYGHLDTTTLEWTDGVFTHILRKIIDNQRGEAQKRHWIVFDGDVDPEWAENLNSVLDDNKLLTLPNGERLALTNNIRIMFEVKDLKHATPATVSRCGMVWFSDDVVSTPMIMTHLLNDLRSKPVDGVSATVYLRNKNVSEDAASVLQQYFDIVGGSSSVDSEFVTRCLDAVRPLPHVMEFDRIRILTSLFSLIKGGLVKVIEYNESHPDFPLDSAKTGEFVKRYLVFAVMWALGGDLPLHHRLDFCRQLRQMRPTSITVPETKDDSLLDYEVRVETQDWEPWQNRIQMLDIEPKKIVEPDQVIDTVDTARHSDIVNSWLTDHKPLIMCGPPGSGKSMTLTSVLRSLPQFELVTLNFSSTTEPDLLMRVFDHHCRVDRTPNGMIMRPQSASKWLVVFCDEINLPSNDKYETQTPITFLRQIVEHGGFWRANDQTFVTLERVQIIGACNPPTDAGRVAMTPRFMRHCPIIFVDFPAAPSLRQIYGTFNRALLKLVPPLRGHADALTDAMIDFYTRSQERFTADKQPHYIYSPRELSRWVRAMFEAIHPMEHVTLEQLVRLWLHEALRLFQDRLVEESERDWTDHVIDEIARKHFPSVNHSVALARPVLFSNWLSKQYVSVEQEELREHVKLRLHVFNEEELDVKLVIFDEVLEHILRIDRVLRQPLGHLLLVGASGSGKTILSKFVSWMNNMSVFQIKVHSKYGNKEFDKDLRSVLTRAGTKNEKICFIFDESNVLSTAFLERMNALLASGEVPGLFEGADWKALMAECKESAKRENDVAESEDELYLRFCRQVQRNLHVVFTMNPSNEDFHNRRATSPALFNRCVIDWFGEWSQSALQQVAFEFTQALDLSDASDGSSAEIKSAFQAVPGSERDNVVQTLVYVHQTVFDAMEHYGKQHAGRTTYVTPRHFLDFIKHYSTLFYEKREQLEEQQRHLKMGLKQLKDTEEVVFTLRTDLTKKNEELDRKNKQANDKLNQMLVDQREAEQKRERSLKIAEEVKIKEGEVSERRERVEKDLAEVEPKLREAEASVKSIKKSQLDELRAFRNPPALVKLAMEPVMMILEGETKSWEDTRKVLRRSDFIQRIVEFKTDNIPDKINKKIRTQYFDDPTFKVEDINRASQVCGPLVKWLDSQLSYNTILNSVEPLQKEIKQLETDAGKFKEQSNELKKMVEELDTRIAQYKTEYAELISEAEKIKQEMTTVKSKVDRSMALLDGLASEKTRWEDDCKSFQQQMSTVVGDCLISAAFLAYIGYFNQSYRRMLVERWQDRLDAMNVPTKPEMSVIEYLSHPSERLAWHEHYLPNDELCVENAIMIKKFNRYPLIIDPSGQATDFLMTHYKEKKIIRTSFLDDAFLKHLEAALRFGNALLVEDVESMDPVLNSVLNKEIFKTGGRVMITLGDKEIDFSPSFTIFLATRDPTVHFTPDLCSRVTFVNFTITHSSLTTQCLSRVLKTERPDIDKKRTDLLKLQGEFRVKLRDLEDQLLMALNNVKGNILEDEKVMSALEHLKKESDTVHVAMQDSEKVMDEIQSVSDFYRPFANSCSRLYFTLENLSEVYFLYQFSLNFFLSVVDTTLANSDLLKGVSDAGQRLGKLTDDVFSKCYLRVARSLLHKDQIAFAVRLAQIYLTSTSPLDNAEVDFLLRGKADAVSGREASIGASIKISKISKILLSTLCALPSFSGLLGHIHSNEAAWARFADPNKDLEAKNESKESDDVGLGALPSGWEAASSEPVRQFHHILVTKVIRPDLVSSACAQFVRQVFGQAFLQQTNQAPDLSAITSEEISCDVPLLLVSRPGYDPSGRVDELAHLMNKAWGKDYESYAMGSPEGYNQADEAVSQAAKRGTWVLLKNVHLAPQWLNRLEKKLHLATPHADFRLFLTMELNDKVPVNLLRMSYIVIYEPPVGIKSSLMRTFNALPADRVNRAPTERARLYFLMSWVHAVVMERLRYTPVGWTKSFEFSEADQQVAFGAVDEWIDKLAQGRANIRPDKIPWAALQTMVLQVSYGGRIDNDADQSRLESLVRSLLTPKSYDANFALAHTFDREKNTYAPIVTIPDANNYQGFVQFIQDMPDIKNPEALGLPHNAELIILTTQGRHVITELAALQEHDVETEYSADTATRRRGSLSIAAVSRPSLSGDQRPEWMVQLDGSVTAWLDRIPEALVPLRRTPELMLDPLFRALEREINFFSSLQKTVVDDLKQLQLVLKQKARANRVIRAMLDALRRDHVPSEWARYKVESLNVGLWIEDFSLRISEMLRIVKDGASAGLGRSSFWLGALRQPEAFVAATRQAVAQDHKWSIEDLHLKVTVKGDSDDKESKDSFVFNGATLFGASWKNGELSLSNELHFPMKPLRFTWIKGARSDTDSNATVPVYLNPMRQHLLFDVQLKTPKALQPHIWSQRGTCLTVWMSQQ